MPRSVDELLGEANAALAGDFRGSLLAQGAARALIWRRGEIPTGGPQFSPLLSSDLANYGFGMLDVGLQLLEAGNRSEITLSTFEAASRALESTVVNGAGDYADTGFLTTIAASAAHLGRFSARAASLLNKATTPYHLESSIPVLRALELLILRRFDELQELCMKHIIPLDIWNSLASHQLENRLIDADALATRFLSRSIFQALAQFLTGLKTAAPQCARNAQERLREAELLALDLNHSIYWWTSRILRFLLDDLWSLSLHNQLPTNPPGASAGWSSWRGAFISLLGARGAAEVELWPSQIEPVKAVFEQSHLVAALPTSAGKTRIAEVGILWALSHGRKIVFVTPLRALSAQTEKNLNRLFGPLGAKVTSFYSGTGFTPGEASLLQEANIAVCTPEKLDFALRNQPDLLDSVGCVILDEGHMLGPSDREIRYELLIQRLTKANGAEGRRLVCLSAMLPTGEVTDDFASWLGGGQPCPVYSAQWKPTRRMVGEVLWDDRTNRGNYFADCNGTPSYLFGFIQSKPRGNGIFPSRNLDFTLACASRLLEEGRSVMIYCSQRNEVDQIANGFVSALSDGVLAPFPISDPDLLDRELSRVAEWLPETHPVIQSLRNGLAVHHANLPRPIQRLVEDLLSRRVIQAVVSSPTLAQGLNLTANCLLFHSVKRRNADGAQRIGDDEVANVAGRAGRAYVDVEGLVLGMGFTRPQRQAWNLAKGGALSGQATIESGLLQVLEVLLWKIEAKIQNAQLAEWVLNNSPISETPDTTETDEDEARAWDLLDTALLATIGETDVPTEDLAALIDEILRDSYLRKRLARITQDRALKIDAILVNRAKRIWLNTTPEARKAWFKAGLGVQSGKMLEQHFDTLSDLLYKAHGAILLDDHESFADAVADLAEVIWTIPPFVPHYLSQQYRPIVAGWLSGMLGRELVRFDAKAMNFVEDAIVYRLTWGIEAVRLLAVSKGDSRFEAESSPVLPKIECGLFDPIAILFHEAGLTSRMTCIALAARFRAANFYLSRQSELREWLHGENAANCSANLSFPSVESHPIWTDFWKAQLHLNRSKRRWAGFELKTPTATLRASDPVIARFDGINWLLLSADFDRLGPATSAEIPTEALTAYGFAVTSSSASVGVWIGEDA